MRKKRNNTRRMDSKIQTEVKDKEQQDQVQQDQEQLINAEASEISESVKLQEIEAEQEKTNVPEVTEEVEKPKVTDEQETTENTEVTEEPTATENTEVTEEPTVAENVATAKETVTEELPAEEAATTEATVTESEPLSIKKPSLEQQTTEETKANADATDTTDAPHRRKFMWIVPAVAVLLLLIYLLPVFYFRNHYLFRTVVNDQDVSRYTVETAEQMLSDEIKTYTLTITGRNDLQDSISSPEIDMDYRCTGDFERIMEEQNEYLWFISLFKPSNHVLEKAVVYDSDKLVERVSELSFFLKENQIEPEDAYIGEYDLEKMQYEIVPEVMGNEIYAEDVLEFITQAVIAMHELLDLTETDCYVKPVIYSDNEGLNHILDAMNQYAGAVITYQFGEETEVLDGSTISTWIEYDGEPDSEPVLNDERIYDYVKSLATTYDTYGKKRDFVTTEGVTMTLPSGAYGWKINKDEESDALKELVSAGTKEIREPIYSSEAAWRGTDDIGSSYVEIDLTAQHLYLYMESELVLESDFVSGDVLTGNTTPPGVFCIRGKTTDTVLRGETWETPVKYWMPFNGGIGMHDATWRRYFGGSIYLTNGSHGCINLPLSVAEKIYGYMHKGFPVICYYHVEEPEEAPQTVQEEAAPVRGSPEDEVQSENNDVPEDNGTQNEQVGDVTDEPHFVTEGEVRPEEDSEA